MKPRHYWDGENTFEKYDKLLLDKPVTLMKADFDKKNNLVYQTEETILFYDAERFLLITAFICLMFMAGILL